MMMDSPGLFALLQCENEHDLNKICRIAVENAVIRDEDVANVRNLLSTDGENAKSALKFLQLMSTSKNLDLPEQFPNAVAELIANAILDANHREPKAATESSCMPQLADFSWRVDVKVASDTVSRLSVPTCLLQLQIRDPPMQVDKRGGNSKVNVALTKEAMDTVLDGLGKIRDQLSNIAK